MQTKIVSAIHSMESSLQLALVCFFSVWVFVFSGPSPAGHGGTRVGGRWVGHTYSEVFARGFAFPPHALEERPMHGDGALVRQGAHADAAAAGAAPALVGV